ncbi:MAG: carbon monoxide dehydrogenase subunit G [Woeseiaceae bacterium]|nr:carbon monoxide dehydrogenase subunit G [Woeseiaceae bacterium]
MEISGEYRIPAARERVWAALNDPDMLQKCLPGCESMEKVGDDEMHADVTAAIGPVRAKFRTRLSLENPDPPNGYTLAGESKAGAAGFARGRADVALAPEDDATRLTYRAELKVGGKLAQVGSRLVAGATRKTADEFFRNLARELDSNALPADREAAPAMRASRWPMAAGALLALVIILWLLLR